MTEYMRNYQKEWRKKNSDKIKEYLKRQRENHPEYKGRYKGRYKRRYKNIEKEKCDKYGIGLGTLRRYGLKIGLAVYDKFKRKCIECGEINDLTIHHLDGSGRNNENKGLPVNNELNNLILICRSCHGSIHGKQGGRGKKSNKERK
jgi:5-methylcytosine-specific restriction endonuclease McrA